MGGGKKKETANKNHVGETLITLDDKIPSKQVEKEKQQKERSMESDRLLPKRHLRKKRAAVRKERKTRKKRGGGYGKPKKTGVALPRLKEEGGRR